MKFYRAVSILLCAVMILAAFPLTVSFAADGEKDHRLVYVHAAGENPQETLDVSTVYSDETANVYLAIDDPNKSEIVGGAYSEPQYNLNGYTVTFYFDPAYFDYADSTQPIDYTVPTNGTGSSGSMEVGPDGKPVGEAEVGYYIHRLGKGTANVGGKEYKTAYATILFSGTFLPEKQPDELWYNLCRLPLTPLKTGNTEVFIAVDSVGEDESSHQYDLELLAKNAVTGDYSPTFTFDVRNGGYHSIQIKDKSKPASPTANPIAGSYTEPQEVTLSADADCKIMYSTDGTSYFEYNNPILVENTTTIHCYAERISDGKKSNTVSYTYKILPTAPFLFDEGKNLLANVYNSDRAFRVYVSDKNVFGNISDGSEVYYTFSQSLSAENPEIIVGADDPMTQWVQVTKGENYQYFDITATSIVRLITKKGEEYSEEAWYNFGIKPAAVTANPGSGEYDQKIEVTLTTETTDAEIYYTIDGSDPRENGIRYSGFALTLFQNTILRTVSKYDGVYSDVATFYYMFHVVDDYGIDAFYPSGVYEDRAEVTLIPQNPDYTVYYSVDGGTSYQIYTKGEILNFTQDTTVLAYAEDGNGVQGSIYSFTYIIKPLAPVFAPETTQFTNASKVTVYRTQTDDSYELYYTTDGSDPVTNGIKADGDSVEFNITKYTVISAVTVKNGVYSSVVTHSYDIVTTKPVKPLITLTPGVYSRTAEGEAFSAQFMPVPNGTTIYYTVSHDGTSPADPVAGMEGTVEYIPGSKLDIYGKTMVKAVAVNAFHARSDIGIFDYTIIPQAPVVPPSTAVSGTLPVVPVTAVEGSRVSYQINGVGNTFVLENGTVFYLDTATGNAYQDASCTQILGTEHSVGISSPAVLTIWAELDGVQSEQNQYRYELSGDSAMVTAPYANKASGVYEQVAADAENHFLIVSLYDLEADTALEYMLNNSGTWIPYDGTGVKLKEDTVLQIRAEKGGKYSSVVSYVYTFEPLAPVIELASGTYSEAQYTKIHLDSRAPADREYTIMYRRNGDKGDVRYMGSDIYIDHTMSLKAYVIDEKSGKISKNTANYYVIDQTVGSGAVYIGYPYDQSTRYSVDAIAQQPYSEGIKLLTVNQNADIYYSYSYQTEDGKVIASDVMKYENTPIIPSPFMRELVITAWLTEKSDGGEITGSKQDFSFTFVKLLVPKTSLEETGKLEFTSGTKYTLINDYPDDENIILYYTLDGSDPADPANENRIAYAGEELTITEETTVKTVYFSSCGKCVNCNEENAAECIEGVYGATGEYQYTVPKKIYVNNGGSSGGNTKPVEIDNTRKYTKDIFGLEHPTHISYISGYPDGSVRADACITREEIAAVLYRVRNKTYDEPVPVTGELFTDVPAQRWSSSNIEYLAHYGIISGYPDGEYKPERNLTRAEFAALIRRFADLKDAETELSFPDVDESLWAYDDIAAIAEAGLIDGYEDGTFRPQVEITRAEVMKIINNLLGRNPLESYLKDLDFNPYTDLEESEWYYTIVLEATVTHNYYLDDDNLEIEWEDYK